MQIDVLNPAETQNLANQIATEYLISMITTINDPVGLLKKYPNSTLVKLQRSSDMNAYINFLTELLIEDLKLTVKPAAITYLVKTLSEDGTNFTKLDDFIKLLFSTSFVIQGYPSHNNTLTAIQEAIQMQRTNDRSEKREALTKALTKPGSFLRILAEADKLYRRDLSESTLLVGGNQRWQFSMMSAMQQLLLNWKQQAENGEVPIELQAVAEEMGGALKLIDALISDLDKIMGLEMFANTEIKGRQDGDPTLHKRITELDLHLDLFAKMFNSKDSIGQQIADSTQGRAGVIAKKQQELNNFTTFNFGADKNSLFSIKGLPIPIDDIQDLYDPETNQIGAGMVEVLDTYIKGELNKAIDEGAKVVEYLELVKKDKVAAQKYLMENLIPGYHYNSKKNIEDPDTPLTPEDFQNGVYFKLGIFSDSVVELFENASFKQAYFETSDNVNISGLFTKSPQYQQLLNNYIAKFNSYLQTNLDYLKPLVLENRENEETGEFETIFLFDIDTNLTDFKNTDDKIIKYILASFINNYELSNLFNGHVAYYKQPKGLNSALNYDDFFKRASVVGSTGLYPYDSNSTETKTYTTYHGETITINKEKHIVVAVVNTVEPEVSEYADLISEARGGEYLNYEHEIADAQGYITPEHFKDIVSRIYGWTELDERMYNELQDDSTQITNEHIQWIKKYSKAFTPLKPVYFGIDENRMPVYLKYSVAPLFPKLVKGNAMQKLLDAMHNQGVEQVVFKSGSKASNHAPTTIVDENNKLKDDMRFNPFVIDASKLKLQVQLPTKLDKQTMVGNQAIKNILTNIDTTDPTKNYLYKDNYYSGQEIYDIINATAVAILQEQLNEVLKQLNYNAETGEVDVRKIKELVISELEEGVDDDLIQLLRSDLPIETIPGFATRIFPLLAAIVKDKAGRIYTNGASVVQVANMGFDELDSTEYSGGIYFFDKNNTKLTPPLPVTDSKGNIVKDAEGRMQIQKAKILLPFASIMKETGMSYDEFIAAYEAGQIDPRIFQNVIGYRIPNQGVNSNDSFEIIGILPPNAGDQAIVYHEITAKTGSDFDIDKMYLMLPNFEVDPDTKEVRYLTDTSKEGLQNNLIEQFAAILEAGVTYDDLMSPLDSPMVKNSINKIRYEKAKAMGDTEAETLEDFLKEQRADGTEQLMPMAIVKARTDVLQAKNLISVMANNMTDLGESQKTNMHLTLDIGLGSTSLARIFQMGKEGDPEAKISKIVSYFMNAAVDAAKDSYIIEGNFTSYTANAGMLMVRLGMDIDDVFTILLNDSIHNFSIRKTFAKAKSANIAFVESEEALQQFAKEYLTALEAARISNPQATVFDVISREDFLSNNPEKFNLIMGFWYLLMEQGKEMNDAVTAMKSDTNGVGKNIPGYLALRNKIQKVLHHSTIGNSILKWFNVDPNDTDAINEKLTFNENIAEDSDAKFLGALANNTIYFMEYLAENLFLETSPAVINAIEDISTALGNPLTSDENAIKAILKYLYPYLIQETALEVEDLFNITEEDEAELLDPRGFAKNFIALKNAYKEADGVGNAFLNEIFFNEQTGILEFPNYKQYSAEDNQRLKEALAEIMSDGQNGEFVKDLVRYAFITTGFKSKRYGFQHLIPASFFIDTFTGIKIRELLEALQDPISNNLDIAEVMTQMAMQDPNNFTLVKQLRKKHTGLFRQGNPDPKILSELTIEDGVYVPFVHAGNYLYMLVDETGDVPQYEPILNTKNQRKIKHDLFSYHSIPQGVVLKHAIDTVEYVPLLLQVFKDAGYERGENFNQENCDI